MKLILVYWKRISSTPKKRFLKSFTNLSKKSYGFSKVLHETVREYSRINWSRLRRGMNRIWICLSLNQNQRFFIFSNRNHKVIFYIYIQIWLNMRTSFPLIRCWNTCKSFYQGNSSMVGPILKDNCCKSP